MASAEQDKLSFQLTQLRKALAALEQAVAEDTGDVKSRNSVLLSYVFSFEMAIKALRAALAVRGLKTPDYAAAVLRAAFQAQLLDDAALWEQFKDHRNNVSHAYDEGMAVTIAAFVRQHAGPAFRGLLDRMERGDD